MCLNRDWRKKIYLSFVQTCLAKTSIIFLTHFLTWCVLSIQLEELRRHSQLPLPYWYHMIRLVRPFTGWDGVLVNHTHRDMTCIMLIWPHFCYSVSKEREREKKMKNEMLYIKSGLDYCTLYFLVGNSSPPLPLQLTN